MTKKSLELDMELVGHIADGIKSGHLTSPQDVLAYLEGWLSAENGVEIGRCTLIIKECKKGEAD